MRQLKPFGRNGWVTVSGFTLLLITFGCGAHDDDLSTSDESVPPASDTTYPASGQEGDDEHLGECWFETRPAAELGLETELRVGGTADVHEDGTRRGIVTVTNTTDLPVRLSWGGYGLDAARVADGELVTRSANYLRSLASTEIVPGEVEEIEVVVGLVPCAGGAIDNADISGLRAILRLDESHDGLIAYVSEPAS
jgi:hypothetical protein